MIKNSIFTILALIILFTGCVQKLEDDPLGADITPVPSGFEVTSFTVTPSSPKFSAGDTLHVMAEFSDVVTAKITITGISSGAVKSYSFEASSIQEDDVNWIGTHDDMRFFTNGEQVEVKLSFFGTEDYWADTVTMTSGAAWPKDEVYFVPGSNFEGSLDWSDGEWWVGGGGDAIFHDLRSREISFEEPVTGSIVDFAPQGDKVFQMYGQRGSTTYIGGGSQGVRDGRFIDAPEDPDEVYVNVFTYGFGASSPATQAYVILYEADGENRRNRAGVDDGVLFQISTQHDGWMLQSAKYSSLPFATYCVAGVEGGGCGNKIHEPHRIDLVALDMGSEGNDPAGAIIDFIILTYGGPFDPSKY